MAKTQRAYVTIVTDPLVLVYPKLETPDVYVDPKTKKAGAPKYKTDAKDLPEGGNALAKAKKAVLAELVKLFPDMDPKTRKRTLANGDTKTVYWPFKTDKDGVETLTCSTGRTHTEKAAQAEAKRAERVGEKPNFVEGDLMAVPMFGANNARLPEGIYPGGGSISCLELTLNAMPNDAGINFYLNSVQILKLVESTYGKSNFAAREGYVYDGPAPGEDAGEEQQSEDGSEPQDEEDATKF